jgi:hypothetical protein
MSNLGHQPNNDEIQSASVGFFREFAAEGMDLGSIFAINSLLSFSNSHSVEIQTRISTSKSECIEGFIFANAKFYSKDNTLEADINIPFKCSTQ